MSVVVRCSLMGEEAVLGCGVSTGASEVSEQFELNVRSADAERVLSSGRVRRRMSGSSDRAPPSSPTVSTSRGQPAPERGDSVWYSCDDEEALEKLLRSRRCRAASPVAGKERGEDPSEESTTVLDESTTLLEESASASSGDKSSEADEVPSWQEDQRVEELRSRLADVLGPATQASQPALGSASARGTVELLGGYPTCFWRFLRSCSDNVDAAEQKLRKTFEFRESIGANSILENPDACKVFKEIEPVWPEVPLGSSSDGSPVSYFDLGKAWEFLQLGHDEDTIRTTWLVWMERSNSFQRQGRSRASGSIDPHDMPGTVVVYNLEDLRLSKLTSCLSGLHQFCRVLSLAEQHYPGNLRKAVIMNPPSIFSKMVWPLVQKVLDAETLSNVVVCSGADFKALTEVELGFSPDELGELLRGKL